MAITIKYALKPGVHLIIITVKSNNESKSPQILLKGNVRKGLQWKYISRDIM